MIRTWVKKKNSNTEQVIKKHICTVLTKLYGWNILVLMYPSFRHDPRTGVAYRSPFMPPGVPDLLVFYKQFALFIEVKRPAQVQKTMLGLPAERKGVLSDHQKHFLDRVKRIGGRACVAYSADEALAQFKAFKVECDQLLEKSA